MFESLGGLVSKNLVSKGAGRSMKAAQVLAVCPAAFDAVLGNGASGRMKMKSFKAGLLVVECVHSTDSEEVRWNEKEIMDEVNRRLGERAVTGLRIR